MSLADDMEVLTDKGERPNEIDGPWGGLMQQRQKMIFRPTKKDHGQGQINGVFDQVHFTKLEFGLAIPAGKISLGVPYFRATEILNSGLGEF